MNKRPFLAPLAVSVATLLSGAAVPAQASTSSERTQAATAPEASPAVAVDQLVLTRSAAGWLITSLMRPTSLTPAIRPMRLEVDSLTQSSTSMWGQACVSDARLFLAGLQH